jgi:hypothetical protein
MAAAPADDLFMTESAGTRAVPANKADLFTGPTVGMPPQHLMARSDAYETARSFELAKQHLEDLGSSSSEDASPASASPVLKAIPTDRAGNAITDNYAFAFDIDGVLIRGGQVIPEAIEAMRVLNGENELGMKV